MNIYHDSDDKLASALSNLSASILTDQDGRRYYSLEHAYQTWKTGSFSAKGYTASGKKVKGAYALLVEHSDKIMYRLMVLKLKTYPHLVDKITKRGGTPYLKGCRHNVYGRDKHWECVAGRGKFMILLINAYEKVKK